MVTIVFSGGGTGGHIYPALAVAEVLRQRISCRLIWIGSNSGIDRSIVESAGLEYFGIPTGKLRRYFSLKNLTDTVKIGAGFLAARRILKKNRPTLLFSKGGFVSVPPCFAAASLGIPVFTHESDFSPGLATRLNLRVAERVFTAYEATARSLPTAYRSRATVVGNPVRPAFRRGNPDKGRFFLRVDNQEPLLLVLGGSQGARQVNDLILGALNDLTALCTVIHQTGPSAQGIPPATDKYRPIPYIKDEMPDVLAASTLVVGRSGAGTLWEAAVAGLPLILIPLEGSGTRGDQVENAEYFQSQGAALLLAGASVTPANLVGLVKRVLENRALRESLVQGVRTIGRLDGTTLIASAIIERIESSRKTGGQE
jgi:UDP-N-acetylglucosamine--N-acetylmuramyl-(pentapeptide) pyrophosphoryl-undecaprenol N-acetylglucosamine transferase